jgi:DNA polymerase elongation subunit (family B)
MDPMLPTTNRYVGTYKNGETKMRGIETRRRDTCKFIKVLQQQMLARMFTVSTKEEIHSLIPELFDIVNNAVKIIRSGKVNPMELVLHRHITKEADEYMNNSISAVVSKLLKETGIYLSPGESIDYIILDASGKRKPEKAKPLALYAFEDGYDIEKYVDLALEAAETLLEPLGYTKAVLSESFESLQRPQIEFETDLFSSTISC